MRIHESGLDRTPDTPTTSNTSTVHTPTLVPSVRDTTTTTASSVADTDTADFSCPHCSRTFTSRIGLVGHLRIHRTETGEPVPGAPTYTHKASFNCPHCPRTFRHRMSLFGHMRIHDDLRETTAGRTTNSLTNQPPPPPPPPHQKSTLTHLMHPTAISHASGKSASRLGPHAASAARVT
nr:unnamed protein product [Spirometra erinaceieuropaei]